jgi:hypothetical protein
MWPQEEDVSICDLLDGRLLHKLLYLGLAGADGLASMDGQRRPCLPRKEQEVVERTWALVAREVRGGEGFGEGGLTAVGAIARGAGDRRAASIDDPPLIESAFFPFLCWSR